ncbi:ribbon-helix-helix domain-containing protein [Frigidibacter sp. MR17.14]|uniref:ribbon-helix-helix domain-containing protein n=1 Tax=Frigidibacter sp. MR17.14 TaxID=3126509 RepID=UPI003012D53D
MARMGRPPVDTEGVTVRFDRATLEKIDAIRRQQEDLPSRPEVVRRAVADWLERNPPGTVIGTQ